MGQLASGIIIIIGIINLPVCDRITHIYTPNNVNKFSFKILKKKQQKTPHVCFFVDNIHVEHFPMTRKGTRNSKNNKKRHVLDTLMVLRA